MATYDEDIQTALDLIAEAGDVSDIIRTAPGPRPIPDPTPWNPVPPVQTEASVHAVWLNYSFGEKMRAGTLIHEGDLKVLIPGADIADITASDLLRNSGGELHQVVAVKTLAPNGQKILFEVQARRQ